MIRKGQIVEILPRWQDDGDQDFVWQALEDEDGGRVRISPTMYVGGESLPFSFPPQQVVEVAMLSVSRRDALQAALRLADTVLAVVHDRQIEYRELRAMATDLLTTYGD